MPIIQTLLRNIVRYTLKANQSRRVKLILTTGLIGISSIYLWQNYALFRQPYRQSQSQSLFFSTNKNHLKDQYNFIVDVSRKCTPSVVTIEVKNSKKQSPDTGEPLLISTGSGFAVRENGWILTNAHVIMNKPNAVINVITTNGKTYEATVHDIDLKLDLAILKISCYNLRPLVLANSKDVLTGEWVVALGSPLSLKHSVTAGVVSSVEREAKELGLDFSSMKFIQTDAAITFGHSGGPLVNLNGEVIGVNNLRVTAGISFAIPIDYVKEFLIRSKLYSSENAKLQASMNKPKFGITALELSDQIVQELLKIQHDGNIPKKVEGVLVWNVVKNSRAFQAGLMPGDVIIEINKSSVSDTSDFYSLLSRFEKQTIVFTIYRKGVKIHICLKTKDM